MRDLGADHIWVVHGHDGLDEISTTGPTSVTEVIDGKISEFEMSPEDYGIDKAAMDDLRGGHPEENAKALSGLLRGETGPYRDIVLLNSGAALMIAGIAKDISDGIIKAQNAIDSGNAGAALKKLIEISSR